MIITNKGTLLREGENVLYNYLCACKELCNISGKEYEICQFGNSDFFFGSLPKMVLKRIDKGLIKTLCWSRVFRQRLYKNFMLVKGFQSVKRSMSKL